MDYEFFHSLAPDEALALLNDFIESQGKSVERMKSTAATDGVALDYSSTSLANVLKWMMKGVRIRRLPVPPEEPDWIRQAHRDGLIDFDDDSRSVILCAAYYLGESFARRPGMRWATGDAAYLHKNMPVVAGFHLDQELPPMVVIRNVFARVLGDGAPSTEIDSTLRAWNAKQS
jgi:hypothetical protein